MAEVICVVALFLFSVIYLFSKEITAYLQAKTEELKAQTELLRKEAEANREHTV